MPLRSLKYNSNLIFTQYTKVIFEVFLGIICRLMLRLLRIQFELTLFNRCTNWFKTTHRIDIAVIALVHYDIIIIV